MLSCTVLQGRNSTIWKHARYN